MNVTFILLGIIGVVYGTLLVGIEFRKWRARIHCRVPVDAVFEKTVTKKMGDRVRTYALFSYYYQENPKKLCYLRKNCQMEDLLTFILGMAFWLSGIFYLIGEFVFFK